MGRLSILLSSVAIFRAMPAQATGEPELLPGQVVQ